MKKFGIVIASFLMIIFASNFSFARMNVKEGCIFTDVDTLRPKQKFTVYYNTLADGAIFKGKENLSLYLHCFKDDLSLVYKLNLKNLDQDTNIYYCNFTMPDNIDCLSVVINKSGTALTWIMKDFAVFAKNRIPSHCGLSRQIKTELDYKKIQNLLSLDMKYYPDYFDRELPHWFGIQDTVKLKSELSAAEAKYYSIINTMTFDEKMNNLLFLATGNIIGQNYGNALKFLKQINNNLNNTNNITNRQLFSTNMNICISLVFQHNAIFKEFINTLLNISIKFNDVKMNSYFVMQNVYHPELLKLYRNEYQQLLSNTVNDVLLLNQRKPERYLLSRLSYYAMFHKLALKLNDTVSSKIILSKIDKLSRQYNYPHFSQDTSDYITDSDNNNGILSSLLSDAGNYYFNRDDYNQAEPYLYRVINQFVADENTVGSISFSEILLAKINIKKEKLDSASYYLYKAIKDGSGLSTETYSMLNAAKSKLGIDTLDFDTYLKKSKIQYMNSYETLANTFITSDRETFSTASLKDTLVFIYYVVDDCVVCNMGITESLKILKDLQIGHPYKVLIVSDKKRSDLVAVWGNNIYTVSRSKCPIQPKDSKNREKSAFALIKGNRILKSESIPQAKESFYEILNK